MKFEHTRASILGNKQKKIGHHIYCIVWVLHLRSLIVISLRVDTCSWPLGHAVLCSSSKVIMPRTSVDIEVQIACINWVIA